MASHTVNAWSLVFKRSMSSSASKAPQHMSGRATRGVFAGRDKRFGNNVSFSQRKTRRSWKPNAHWKNLFSEALDKPVRLNVTTHALRCIDKAGGLDNYLLSAPEWHIGTSGLEAKGRILAAINEHSNSEEI